MVLRIWLAAVVSAAVVVSFPTAGATPLAVQAVSMTAYSVPVSASVLVTVVQADGSVELVVLWRGSPRWWMGPRHDGESYSGSQNGLTAVLPYGSQRLMLSYTREARVVSIQDHSLDMGRNSNVVFVDFVDSAREMSIRNGKVFLHNDGPVDARNGSLGQLIRKSADIAAFLRCDNPDEYHLGPVACDALKR